MPIEPVEFRRRQQRFAQRLRAAGYDGALVVSRGGGTFDRCGNVLYLTGHYQHYPYLPSEPPNWSGRAHTAFVLSADGEGVLCISTEEFHRDGVAADHVLWTEDFPLTIVAAIRELEIHGSHLALIGGDTLPASFWFQIEKELTDTSFVADDEVLAALKRIKSPEEQEEIRRAAVIGRRAMTEFLEKLDPGSTEAEAVAAAVEVVVAEGSGLYYAAASSGNDTWSFTSSPLPGYSTRQLESGDLFRFDLCTVHSGYFSDFGRTAVVGQPSSSQKHLLDTLHGVLDAVIDSLKPGMPVSEVVRIGDQALVDAGIATNDDASPGQIEAVYPAHWGHGLGLGWERPWLIESEMLTVEPGMFLAVERSLHLKDVGTAAAEQNLLVGETGAELLTSGVDGRWN